MTRLQDGKSYLKRTDYLSLNMTKYFKSKKARATFVEKLHTKLVLDEIWLSTTIMSRDESEGCYATTVTIDFSDGIYVKMLQKLDELLNT